jgi:hypothetical protein
MIRQSPIGVIRVLLYNSEDDRWPWSATPHVISLIGEPISRREQFELAGGALREFANFLQWAVNLPQGFFAVHRPLATKRKK